MAAIIAILGTEKNFTLKRGNSWVYSWRQMQYDGVTPLDLSGADFSKSGIWLQGKDPETDLPDLALDKGAGISITGAGNEQVDIEKIIALLERNYIYRIRAIITPTLIADLIYGTHIYADKK